MPISYTWLRRITYLSLTITAIGLTIFTVGSLSTTISSEHFHKEDDFNNQNSIASLKEKFDSCNQDLFVSEEFNNILEAETANNESLISSLPEYTKPIADGGISPDKDGSIKALSIPPSFLSFEASASPVSYVNSTTTYVFNIWINAPDWVLNNIAEVSYYFLQKNFHVKPVLSRSRSTSFAATVSSNGCFSKVAVTITFRNNQVMRKGANICKAIGWDNHLSVVTTKRISIYYNSVMDRETIESLVKACDSFKKNGYEVLRFPLKDHNADLEVRYFHNEDAAVVQDIAKVVDGWSKSHRFGKHTDVRDAGRKYPGEPFGSFEIWIPMLVPSVE